MLRRTAEILAYTNQARRSTAEILACPEGVSLTLRMTGQLSFWGKYATAAGGQNCDCRRWREKGTVLRRRNGVEGSPFGRRATTIPTSAERERVCGGGTERRAAPQGRYLRSEAWQMGGKRLFDMLRRRRYRPARGSVRGVTTKARRAVFASLPSYGRDPSLRSG